MTRTNRQPNRRARLVFRLGVTVCVVIVAVSVAVILTNVFGWFRVGSWTLMFGPVGVAVEHSPLYDSLYGWRDADMQLWTFQFEPNATFIPSWFLLCAALIPTYLAWRRLPRKFPPGVCRKCGYDLTGNVTGKCSECGTKIEGGK